MQSFKHARSGTAAPERNQDKTSPAAPEREHGGDEAGRKRNPPDSIPDPMPGVDPQQTPGVDHPPAEWD